MHVTSIKLKIIEWAGSSLFESEHCSISQKITHSVRPHTKIIWLEIHLNPAFIWTEGAWLILSGFFILYSVAYQKADQDKLKMAPLNKMGSHLFKKVCFKLAGPFTKCLGKTLTETTPWWPSLICQDSFYSIKCCLSVKGPNWCWIVANSKKATAL